MKVNFYTCVNCGNIAVKIVDSGVDLVCCGKPMVKVIANSVEASEDKHLPVVTIEGDVIDVNIGTIDHPMEEDHYITFIYLQTKNGGQRKALSPGDAPHVSFRVVDDEAIAVFAHCNTHGIWKTEL